MTRIVLLALLGCASANAASRREVQTPDEAQTQEVREGRQARATGAHPAPAAHDCVDPYADARARLEDSWVEGSRIETYESRLDLDEDGRADPILTTTFAGGSGGSTYELYFQREDCAVWAGELTTTEFQALTKTHGAVGLMVSVQAGSCHWWERAARFDGTRYVIDQERECRCRFDDAPRCGSWTDV